MIILALDASGVSASCALLRDGVIAGEINLQNGLVHSRSLLPMTEQVLTFAGCTMEQVDGIACVAGPGSFTGVRMSVCAAKGLAAPRGIPCVQIDTLECLAASAGYNGWVCPILDARRGQVYTALFAPGGRRERDDDAMPLEELAASLGERTVFFTGDGVPAFAGQLHTLLGERAITAPPHLCYPRAAAAALLAQEALQAGKGISAEALCPIYLRKPQAEREYDARH